MKLPLSLLLLLWAWCSHCALPMWPIPNTVIASAGANLYRTKLGTPAGSTIVVGPGLYTTAMGATNLFKDRVNWFFWPGAVISNYADGATVFLASPFDDSAATGTAGPIRCRVDGYGSFIHRGGVQNEAYTRGMLTTTDPGTEVYFECDEMLLSAVSPIMNAVLCSDAKRLVVNVHNRIDAAYGPDEFGASSTANGLWWSKGEFVTICPVVITSGRPAFYSDGTADGNWYGRHEYVYCTNSTAIVWTGSGANGKLWLTGQEILGNSFSGFGQVLQQAGGKLYLEFDKYSTYGATRDALFQQSAGGLWVRGDKITTTNLSPFMLQSGGTSDYTIQQWEDAGPGASEQRAFNWALLGGTNWIRNGRAYTRSGPGYFLTNNVTTARAQIQDMVISTRGAARATNYPIWNLSTTTNFYVQNTLLLSPYEQGAHSIFSSVASTPILLAASSVCANTNAHANVTISAGTLTVDVDYNFVPPP